MKIDLSLSNLRLAYKEKTLTPRMVIEELTARMNNAPKSIWISKTSQEDLELYLNTLEHSSPEALPLYGIPFAIKDNIDLKGLDSTSACPGYAYSPKESAFVIKRLIEAGAIPLGKTNMDQFATGLVGVRSPYGTIPNRYHSEYISGGSSSGSAAALAYNLCSFALGTDTAGSGRVPAAFNNLVGLKPTRGALSCTGVIPACKSLDCVSIFALNIDDAKAIFKIAAKEDEQDPYSREMPGHSSFTGDPAKVVFGVPQSDELNFFGNQEYEKAFALVLQKIKNEGYLVKPIRFKPFLDAAKLLYEGPWVFERYSAVGKFIDENPDKVHEVTRSIISPKEVPHPSKIFDDLHKLQSLKKMADQEFKGIDILITPTAGTIYKTEEVLKDPIATNSNLGYYTNYMNLLDYSALAIPAGFTETTKLPFGITLVGQAFKDASLLEAGKFLTQIFEDQITFAVCGAHLKGGSLHGELENACFLKESRTAAEYKMFAIDSDTGIEKPALIRTETNGNSFYVELYSFSKSQFGKFVSKIPAPLGMGKIKLHDGTWVTGFIAEGIAADMGKDISSYEDWREYKKSCPGRETQATPCVLC